MAIITPTRFPNKSENSKPLLGIIICNISKIKDEKNKYKINNLK